ncbi:hypothetical protein [Marinovum sp.]|uniref:hypothetical protein n=1 Tax=Marinovum sp. TaxID=2024839 RepID=UPI002B27516C|nr:hypothetical protein [Marinovum sp.]
MIADSAKNLLINGGATGEIVISGPYVTPGYEGNPNANAENFFEADGKRWSAPAIRGRSTPRVICVSPGA